MREFLLSLGMALGIVGLQPDPAIACRAFQHNGYLVLNVEVQNALNDQCRELVMSGTPVELVLGGTLNGVPFRFGNRLVHDPLTGDFAVQESRAGNLHHTRSLDVASRIQSNFYALELASLSGTGFPCRIDFSAWLELPESPDADAMLLWHYTKPSWNRQFNTPLEIPR